MASEDRKLALVASAGLHDTYRTVVESVKPMAATGFGRISRRDETLGTLAAAVVGLRDEIETMRDTVALVQAEKAAEAAAFEAERTAVARRQALAKVHAKSTREARAAALARVNRP